jgi:serine/tyrosine/threonine adenylyltransferase
MARHYPDAAGAAQPYRALLEAIVLRQADLIAKWLPIGFIHGVMNTDNCSVAGETIDYGPCAFMDAYDPATVFSSIDQQGRYAYGNQPRIAHWNLTRLAEALLPILSDDNDTAVATAKETLAAFALRFETAYLTAMRRKIGLATDDEGDPGLIQDLLTRMAGNGADMTLTFRRLCAAATGPEGDAPVRALFTDGSVYDGWAERWRARLQREPGTPAARRAAMRTVNPAYIPRNHLVEAALTAATERGDFGPFEDLLTVLSQPFEERDGLDRYAVPPEPGERVYQTFCGT